MKKGLEEILNICLERITVKGDSIEQCLENYPEHTAELEPLLRAALSIRAASSAIKPRPEFKGVAKYRLLSAIEAGGKKRTERSIPLWRWQRRWAVALATILILVLIGGSTVTASASSLPGDVLYPVKTATEKVQGFFTFGSEAKASFHMKLAQRRLNELELLTEGNRTIPQSLLNVMSKETDYAIEILGQNRPAKEELLAKLTGLTSDQSAVLREVMGKIPSQAKSKLREALKRAEQAHNRAILLKGKGPEMEKPGPESIVPGANNVWPSNGGGNASSSYYSLPDALWDEELSYGNGNESGGYWGVVHEVLGPQQQAQPGGK